MTVAVTAAVTVTVNSPSAGARLKTLPPRPFRPPRWFCLAPPAAAAPQYVPLEGRALGNAEEMADLLDLVLRPGWSRFLVGSMQSIVLVLVYVPAASL